MKHFTHFRLALIFLLMAISGILSANNISISNLVLTGKNTTSQYTMVQFDISWENSWRSSSAPNNWDAAWVFVKYRVAGGEWQHAWLNDIGQTAPSGSIIDVGLLTPGTTFNVTTNPGLGAFIYRSAFGSGANTFTGVQLRWNYGANGVADNALVDIRVFAIEMVCVPEGAFTVGSGGTESGSFTNGSWASGATIPLSIASENALTVANTAGNLWYTSTSANIGDRAGPIPATFPKGFNAFYSMKYEVSQQQYVDFLNTLTQTQATARKYSGSSYRYAITGSAVGSYATTNPYVACNYLSWNDGTAYADWAGLRPMSELEFEKACRGTAAPVANEYAWGSTSITSASGITNGGLINETATNAGAGANACYNNTSTGGPIRVGAFATGTTTRVQAGSSYWGILELSGNLVEREVTIGNANGRAFTGLHGDGALTSNGEHDVTNWPAGSTASGSGQRDGAFDNFSSMLRVSDRMYASNTSAIRASGNGFRAVRNVPPFTCGVSTLTINHLSSGGIAPVDKTVTYGTVTNIPGELSKCWITRNLGASQQATAKNDATEASAGWYWQFNRKQGYQYDGSTRTPGGAWNSISENSDWLPANDPCALELGTGWRIPTNTEWNTVFTSGGWNVGDGPWNSDLKIHAAGTLGWQSGVLESRGTYGRYWSSTQTAGNNNARFLYVSTNASQLAEALKSFGFTLRCLRDLLSTLTTTAVTSITATTASSGGNVTSAGGSAVTERGVCWSTTTGPTIALATKTTDGSGTGIFTSAITGLATGTLYYLRAYATNSAGTAYGNEISFTTLLAIGDNYQGGKVAYILQPGDSGYDASMQKGLIAALADQSTGIAWITGGSTQSTLNGNTLTAYGKGQANTSFMMAQTGFTGGAAKVCDDYTNTETGTGVYSDWYLPSLDELAKLYAMKVLGFGGFADGLYWSSSEAIASIAWSLNFTDGWQGTSFKAYSATYVRAVRSFPTLPTVTTSVPSYGGGSTASGGGEVTSAGDFPVTERGVCWSTTTFPTITDSHSHDGTGTGIFYSELTDLYSDYYFVRAYATNSAGTAYGNQQTLPACFVAGTKITMADGSIKNIEDVLVGDKVRSVNSETMETVARTVIRTIVNPPSNQLLSITFSNGIVNTNTKIHPYWVKGKGWSSVDPTPYKGKEGFSSVPLAVGDQCQVLVSGKLLPLDITKIELLPNLAVPTYNFSVEETNCYFANGILVHNK